MRPTARAVSLALAALATATPAVARGDDFLVNVTTTGNQGDPSVASDPIGNTLVVWTDEGPSNRQIRGRWYSPFGVPLPGSELTLNSLAGGLDHYTPAVAGSAPASSRCGRARCRARSR